MSFWIGVAFIGLAQIRLAFSIVQYRRALRTWKPIEILDRYCTWSGIAMNRSVVGLGIGVSVLRVAG